MIRNNTTVCRLTARRVEQSLVGLGERAQAELPPGTLAGAPADWFFALKLKLFALDLLIDLYAREHASVSIPYFA